MRVDAWEREHGPMKSVRFLPMPVQANGPEWDVLVAMCHRLAPALVIIDTQARVTLGLDENSNSDMGRYVDAVDRIKRATGACVLTVHHLGRNGTNARGASAIDGAQDAELRVRKAGTYVIELVMDKQKDQAEAEPVKIRLKRSEGGTDSGTGRDLSSLVLDHAVMGLGEAEGPVIDVGALRARVLYGVIRDEFNPGEGGTRAEIRALFMGRDEIARIENKDTRGKAWTRSWSLLIQLGLIIRRSRSSAERFKLLVLSDQSDAGVLTANAGAFAEDAPSGFVIWWPDDEAAEKHSKESLAKVAKTVNADKST